jgi:hypothetical protein
VVLVVLERLQRHQVGLLNMVELVGVEIQRLQLIFQVGVHYMVVVEVVLVEAQITYQQFMMQNQVEVQVLIQVLQEAFLEQVVYRQLRVEQVQVKVTGLVMVVEVEVEAQH